MIETAQTESPSSASWLPRFPAMGAQKKCCAFLGLRFLIGKMNSIN